jgi:opacity protein-like surface antigen
MMKKTILILVVLALLVPAAAMAATEFSLGGFIKLDSFWDSTQQGKNMNTAIPRNNDQLGQHGRFNMTAQGSRFNFTIKGPTLWGATTTGFIEMDFDQQGDAQQSASHAYIPRLRHAMFFLNWPDT